MVPALSDVVWVTAGAAIALAQVEITIRSKGRRASIVVPVGMRNLQKNSFGRRVCFVRVSLRDLHFAQDLSFWALLGVVQIEPPIALVLWMKGERQQPLLVLDVWFAACDIDEHFRLFYGSVLRKNVDPAVLFDDNHSLRAIRDFLHPQRPVETQIRECRLQIDCG